MGGAADDGCAVPAHGLTERATHRIVDELVQSSYVTRHKLGNRSFYEVHADRALNENAGATVGELLRPLIASRTQAPAG